MFWIDAICINQQDVAERSIQILAMGAVYSRARQVVVWLGPGDPESDEAMDAMNQATPSPTSSTSATTASLASITDIDAVLVPWWRRLWVVQEFVLADTDPLIVCRHRQLAWDKIRATTDAIVGQRRSEDPDERMTNNMFPMLLDSLRSEMQARRPAGAYFVTDVILHLLDFRSADPRDKIYACLGLLDPATRTALAPDYNKSVQQVYTDAARQILASHDLTFFTAFSFGRSDDADNDIKNNSVWPSWVPDFCRMAIRTPRNPISFTNSYGWRGLGSRRSATIREESVVERQHPEATAQSPQLSPLTLTSPRLVAGITGSVFDTIDAVVILQGEADLLR